MVNLFLSFFEFPDWEISEFKTGGLKSEGGDYQEQASQLKFSFTHAMLCCESMIIYEICENNFSIQIVEDFCCFGWLLLCFLGSFSSDIPWCRKVGPWFMGNHGIKQRSYALNGFLKLWMPAQIPFNMTSWRLFCDKSECQCIKW